MRTGYHNTHSSFSNRNSIWWAKRSRLEKLLLTSSSFTLILCFTLAIVLLTVVSEPEEQQHHTRLIRAVAENPQHQVENAVTNSSSSLCLSSGCVLIAAEYLQNGNFSVDPCEDFYSYACGLYEANVVIPDHESSKTSFQEAEDLLNNRLRQLLESPPGKHENDVFPKVTAFYNACMNKTEIGRLKEKPLHDILKHLGGWPAVEGRKWSQEREENFDWTQTIYAMRKKGLNHNILVDLSVSVDSLNSSTYTIEVDEPSLGMPGRNYLLKGIDDPVVKKYMNFMKETAMLLGANSKTLDDEIRDTVLFEIKLANYTLPKEDRRNYTELYNKKTLEELNTLAPIVNWVEYANEMLTEKVDKNEVVIAVSPRYLGNLTEIINETPKRTVANYLMWRTSMSVLGMLDDRFRNIWLEYVISITGQAVDDPRWRICMTSVRSYFGNAVGAMYVRKYLDKDARSMALTLVKDVRQELKTILNTIDWMDNITLKRATVKADAMDEMIAYPLELLNDTLLEDHYKKIKIKENRFFETTLEIKKEWSDYRYAKLRQAHKRTDWKEIGSVAVVNAYYSPSQNLIMFPAGILQGVFFGSDRPKYINYGAIGFVIGHEITHGFDDQGRQFDEIGDLKDWWEPETDEKFQKKTKCIIDQYSHYNMTEVNMTINGINTQGENIADNGGVKEAHRAYEKWVKGNGEEKPLPGLNLTTRQMFWLSYANVWCSKTRPEAMKLRILTGVHSPQKYRVNGVVSNSPEFSADFKCPVGSKMNPKNKCVVW